MPNHIRISFWQIDVFLIVFSAPNELNKKKSECIIFLNRHLVAYLVTFYKQSGVIEHAFLAGEFLNSFVLLRKWKLWTSNECFFENGENEMNCGIAAQRGRCSEKRLIILSSVWRNLSAQKALTNRPNWSVW